MSRPQRPRTAVHHAYAGFRKRSRPDPYRGRDAPLLPRLRHERDRGPRPAGCPRRAQARAPAHPVRHAREQHRLEPPLRQVRPGGRRRARQVPPPRRHGDLRRPGAHGPAVLPALPADRRPGQLRLGGRGPPGGLPLHREPDVPARRGPAGGHRQGHRRFRPELRQQGAGAHGPAQPGAQPAGERLLRHRRGHGHQYPAAQPARGLRRLPGPDRRPQPHGR